MRDRADRRRAACLALSILTLFGRKCTSISQHPRPHVNSLWTLSLEDTAPGQSAVQSPPSRTHALWTAVTAGKNARQEPPPTCLATKDPPPIPGQVETSVAK